jgi:hypothetical protein
MLLLDYSYVGKKPDISGQIVTPGGSLRQGGGELGRLAPPLKIFPFDQKILAVQKSQ